MAFDLKKNTSIKEEMSKGLAMDTEKITREETEVETGNVNEGFVLPQAVIQKAVEKREPMTLNVKPSVRKSFHKIAKKQGYRSASDFFEELVKMMGE